MLFREKYQELLPEERAKISNLDDLSAPCQIEVFWVTNTRFELSFQLLLVSHLKDMEDLHFAVHGPFESYDAPHQLKSAILANKWNRALPEQDVQRFAESTGSYPEIVEDALVEFSHHIRAHISSLIFQKPTELPPVCNRRWLTSEASYWFIVGDIRLSTPETIIGRIFKTVKEKTETEITTVPRKVEGIQTDTRKDMKGYGTFLYPPVWFGGPPRFDLSVRIMGSAALIGVRPTVDSDYRGHKVIVYQDGYIAIVEKDKHKACVLLNELIAAISFLYTPSFALKESELGEVTIDLDDLTVKAGSMSLISERTRLFEDRWTQWHKYKLATRTQLSGDELLQVLKRAKEIMEDKDTNQKLLLWLEAFTYFKNSDFTQSFIMSWIVIEKYISNLWIDFLREHAVKGKRLDKFKDVSRWTTDHFLEVLCLSQKLKMDDYQEYMRLKGIRNGIIHKGETVIEANAKSCLARSKGIIAKQIEIKSK
jgi:hypothetical protein